VTLLKEAGIPAAVVMELIGHDSEQTSEHYIHVGSEALKKAAKSMPDDQMRRLPNNGDSSLFAHARSRQQIRMRF
jgi:hypothetical protein